MKFKLIAVAAAAVLSVGAYAQDSTSTSGATTSANANNAVGNSSATTSSSGVASSTSGQASVQVGVNVGGSSNTLDANGQVPGRAADSAGAIGSPTTPYTQRVEYGTQTVKSTGSAFLPGMAVASGSFNCGATGGIAAGWPGGAVSIGGAKSLSDCVSLNLMNFAALSKDDELYVALLCGMSAGSEAMKRLNRPCPNGEGAPKVASAPPVTVAAVKEQEEAAKAKMVVVRKPDGGVTVMSDKSVDAELAFLGANLKDPYIKERHDALVEAKRSFPQ